MRKIFGLSRKLLAWYDRSRRELPWRKHVTPYRVLVSELMLQQTQVATVIPYFQRFVTQFPTIEALACADEQEVLRLWQGLGYYRRARYLHALARQVVAHYGGKIPSSAHQLIALPGIGRYTAGAIASIAFGRREPIVDGNVARVLCRLDRIEDDPRSPSVLKHLWQRAGELVPNHRCGDFNSALMELGATLCTSRHPRCSSCPVRNFCDAFVAGVQDYIPLPRVTKPLPLVRRTIWCIRRGHRWLIERRPSSGRWAGLWQFLTTATSRSPLPLVTTHPRSLATIEHRLSHRHYRFTVLICNALPGRLVNDGQNRKWVTLADLPHFPLSRPHLRLAEILQTV